MWNSALNLYRIRYLTNLRKPFASGDVFAAHEEALEAGLHIAHYFLLGGPGENKQTLQKTLIGLDSLERAVFFFFCGIRIYPHTALYDVALREGQIAARTKYPVAGILPLARNIR